MSIQVPFGNQHADERFTGHGSEWKDSNLNPDDAKTATQWVEAKIDKRSMLTTRKHVEDVRDIMWQLEKDGEIVVHRVNDGHEPVMTKNIVRLGQENSYQPSLASQVLRSVWQHSGLPDFTSVADE